MLTQSLQAGAAAAFTVDMLIFPLDTLKTRYQSQDYIKTYSTSQSKPLALRGLYQGIGSAVLATLPAGTLQSCSTPSISYILLPCSHPSETYYPITIYIR